MAFSDPGGSCQVDKNKSNKIEASVDIETTQSNIEYTSRGPEAYKVSTLNPGLFQYFANYILLDFRADCDSSLLIFLGWRDLKQKNGPVHLLILSVMMGYKNLSRGSQFGITRLAE